MGGLEQVMSEAPTTTHPLRLPLVCALVLVVDATEVGYDYRDRQGDHQHPTERANSSHDLAGNRLGYHVAVPAHTNNSLMWQQECPNFSPFRFLYVHTVPHQFTADFNLSQVEKFFLYRFGVLMQI